MFRGVDNGQYCLNGQSQPECWLGDNDTIIPGAVSQNELLTLPAGPSLGFRPGWLPHQVVSGTTYPYAILSDNSSDFARGTRRYVAATSLGCYGYYIPQGSGADAGVIEALHAAGMEMTC